MSTQQIRSPQAGLRRLSAAVITLCIVSVALFLGAKPRSPSSVQDEQWIKIVFGIDDRSAVWDGQLVVEDGDALAMRAWGLESVDQLDLRTLSWQITTGRATLDGQSWRPSFPEPARGFLVKLKPSAATRLRATTQQGDFVVTLQELQPGRPTPVLDERATVELLGVADFVAETRTQDDFPAIAIGPSGHRYVGWIAFNPGSRACQLLVKDVDDPSAKPRAIAGTGEFSNLHLLATATGLRAIWCSPASQSNWDIYTSTSSGKRWTPAKRLTTAAGNDFHLAVGQKGSTTWIAWQSFRSGNADIYAMRHTAGEWSNEIRVTTDRCNDWEPAIDVDSNGQAWIGYDTYQHGNYDVYLRSVTITPAGPRLGEPVPIARSPSFEAHANVLVTDDGRVWVAFDRGGANWGKDGGFLASGERAALAGEPPHRSRRLGLRCLVAGQLHTLAVDLPQQKLLPAGTRFYEYPQLAEDGNGRLWLFFRMCRQGSLKAVDQGNCWDIFATTFTSGGWLEPIQLPDSEGRQNQRVGIAEDTSGNLLCAWSEGNHFIVREDRKYSVHYGRLPQVSERAARLPLKAISAEPPSTPEASPTQPWTIPRGGQQYQLYFGDLHRHTNISICLPRDDGCQTDAHRYALDAADLDFLALTEHTHDLDAYAWWRVQSEADRFHVPGHYVPIYAYERSNYPEGGGHRNVYFLDRGWEVNGSDYYYRYHPDRKKLNTDPDRSLYPWLKQREGAFTIAHTPAYSRARQRGTWDFHDSQVEPVAEIFQGYTRSFERPNQRVIEQASLWHALSKGYRLGFIASSDHQSTHISYACVWATEKTRPALFKAILARRTYAATDRIALDFRIDNTLMGGEMPRSASTSTLRIRAQGTAQINEIQIVRSGRVLHTLRPNQRQVDTVYTDPHPVPGPCYYYVRLHQADGNLAWGSPIWITN